MQSAVEQFRAELTARLGRPQRYDAFQYWTVGDSVRTRITMHFDGVRCQVYVSDRTTTAPALLAEFTSPADLPAAMQAVRERLPGTG
jgi:hypothetical protein